MKKLLAIILCVITVLGVFAGCGASNEIVVPEINIPETAENRKLALIQTAWAYYNKNPYVQYDQESLTVGGRMMGVRNAADMNNTPEMATPQRNIFHVCSYLVYSSVFHAYDYKINGGWENTWIKNMANPTADLENYMVYYHLNTSNYKATKNITDEDAKAMEEFRNTLQVGDIVTYTRPGSGSGHTLIWAGDCDGDGDNDILNVDGSYYDDTAMEDVREINGAVDVNTNAGTYPNAEYFFFDPAAYDFFPKVEAISILRFWDEKHAETIPMTDRAKTRMMYPGLKIWFESERGVYGYVPQGEEYTFSLTLENISEADHKGLLIQLPTPTNAEIVKVNGKAASNKVVKLQADVPAGGSVKITYTIKATGKVGDIITSNVGYVHAIPLPNLNTVITSKQEDAAQVKAALEKAKSKTGEAYLAAYLKEMGYDAKVTLDEVHNALYNRKNVGENKMFFLKAAEDIAAEDMTIAKMFVPDFHGGMYMASAYTDDLRVKEARAQDLHAGDIVIYQVSATDDPIVAIHNGEGLMVPVNGTLQAMTQTDLDHFVKYRFFIALRPSQSL